MKINNLKKKLVNIIKNKRNIKSDDVDYNTLTIEKIKSELKKETYKEKYIRILKSTISVLVIVIAISTVVATYLIPVIKISGNSMTPTYVEGDILVALNSKRIKPGDIVAFYHGNKIMVKRVIAGDGSYVNIDSEGNVYVDGDLIEEVYVSEKKLGDIDVTLPYEVPAGKWFVLNDNRLLLTDSRRSEIGCVEEDDIIGKIVFRIWPIG